MNIIWNETRVRDELKCLDQKTGLCGADIRLYLIMQSELWEVSAHTMEKQNSFAFQITIFRIRISLLKKRLTQ